jgi:ketosteroid isomerase-like protein
MLRDVASTPEDFIECYERALASQLWDKVAPLIRENACVTFSNGSVHKGKSAIQIAFEKNFAAIADEQYRISNIHWIHRSSETAVYIFQFSWSGLINGRPASGAGSGTSVLQRDPSGWQLLAEHLGPAPV